MKSLEIKKGRAFWVVHSTDVYEKHETLSRKSKYFWGMIWSVYDIEQTNSRKLTHCPIKFYFKYFKTDKTLDLFL
jgi:hypothetical protein